MTLEAWVHPTASGSPWRTAIMKERPLGLAYALYANDGSSNRAAGYFYSGGDRGVHSPAARVPLNTWTHLATTYDGANLRIYVNGAQVATTAVSGAIAASSSPLRFGGNGTWLDEFFQGRIDEVRVYNRALTVAEIGNDMSSPIGSPAPPSPQLSVTPSSLSFSATEGAGNPAAKSLSVANTGGGTSRSTHPTTPAGCR